MLKVIYNIITIICGVPTDVIEDIKYIKEGNGQMWQVDGDKAKALIRDVIVVTGQGVTIDAA